MAGHDLYIQLKLTPWSWALLKTLVVWTLESFPTFYGTRKFNTDFTRALYLSLSWARPIQSTSPHSTSTRFILILSTHPRLGLSNGLLHSGTPTNLYAFFSPNSCYIPRPSHPRLNYSNNTWQRRPIHIVFLIWYSKQVDSLIHSVHSLTINSLKILYRHLHIRTQNIKPLSEYPEYTVEFGVVVVCCQ
jgi:hypothetical protein